MNSTIRTLFSCCLIAPIMASLAHAQEPAQGQSQQPTPVTKPAPTMIELAGLPKSALQGALITEWEKDKLYVFEFWATWCQPCIAAIPHINELHAKLKDENLIITGVNVFEPKKTPEDLKKFLAGIKSPPTYNIAADTEGNTKKSWLDPLKIDSIPHAIIVRNGELLWRGHPAGLSQEIVMHLLGKGPAPAATAAGADPRAKQNNMIALHKLSTPAQYKEAIALLEKLIADETQPIDDKVHYCLVTTIGMSQSNLPWTEILHILQKSTQLKGKDAYIYLRMLDLILFQYKVEEEEAALATANSIIQHLINTKIAEKPSDKALVCLMQSRIAEIKEDIPTAIALQEQACQLGDPAMQFISRRLKSKLADNQDILEELLDSPALQSSHPAPIAQTMIPVPQLQDLLSRIKPLHNYPFSQCNFAGLPKNTAVFIEIWFPTAPFGGMANRLPLNAPGAPLDAIFRAYELKGKNAIGIVLAVASKDRSKAVADRLTRFYPFRTDYPVGVIENIDNNPTFFGILADPSTKDFPSLLVVRDGVVLSITEPSRVHSDTVALACAPTFSPEMAEELKKSIDKRTEIVSEFMTKPRRGAALEQYMKDHAEDLKNSPTLATMCYEASMSRQATTLAKELLDMHPQDFFVANRLFQLLQAHSRGNSSSLIMQCAETMAKRNLRPDPEYAAACWLIVAQIALEQNDIPRSIHAAQQAALHSANMRRLLQLRTQATPPAPAKE